MFAKIQEIPVLAGQYPAAAVFGHGLPEDKRRMSEGKMDYYGTIGPACADSEILKRMKEMGMTGLRMNLSHGSLRERGDWLRLIRETGVEQLLIDLQGPELRIGELGQPLELSAGAYVRLIGDCSGEISDCNEINNSCRQKRKQNDSEPADICRTAMQYDRKMENCREIPCPDSVREALGQAEPGLEILLDDGKILLQMEGLISEADSFMSGMRKGGQEKTGLEKYADRGVLHDAKKAAILCKTVRGGILKSHKSIALPGLTVSSPTLTTEDHENLKLAAASGVTGVMLPFVRGRKDILVLREALQRYGAENVKIFAKIENLAGVASLPEFVSDVDHVVIARGDLGNAMPLWELPGCQKRIAAVCREAGTPFMVVTQMLDSMHTRAVPTRAEVCDIYNAVLDGAASVMLTGETAAGQYPVEAMEYLVRTGECAREDVRQHIFFSQK